MRAAPRDRLEPREVEDECVAFERGSSECVTAKGEARRGQRSLTSLDAAQLTPRFSEFAPARVSPPQLPPTLASRHLFSDSASGHALAAVRWEARTSFGALPGGIGFRVESVGSG
jgi:hypothetical protein